MYSAFRHCDSIIWKRKPVHLTFFLTRRCNARCPFCFYLRSAGFAPNKEEELSLDEIEKISRSLGNLLWVAFSGGEIYLREDLAEISSIFYEYNRPAIMLFSTNGMLPEKIKVQTQQVLERCPKSTIVVKLSVDGVGEAHDGLRDTFGSFRNTLETYRLLEPFLQEYPHFELGINTVFCSENQDEMDGIIDFVRGLHTCSTHTISLVRGKLANDNYKNIDAAKYLGAITRLEKNSRQSGRYRFAGARIKAAQDVLQRRLIHRTLKDDERQIPCFAGRLNLVLTESGYVYPCEMLRKAFGNVREYGYDVRKVLRSERAKQTISGIKAKHCHCTHECYMMTNILFNPRLYPLLAREYSKGIR